MATNEVIKLIQKMSRYPVSKYAYEINGLPFSMVSNVKTNNPVNMMSTILIIDFLEPERKTIHSRSKKS